MFRFSSSTIESIVQSDSCVTSIYDSIIEQVRVGKYEVVQFLWKEYLRPKLGPGLPNNLDQHGVVQRDMYQMLVKYSSDPEKINEIVSLVLSHPVSVVHYLVTDDEWTSFLGKV